MQALLLYCEHCSLLKLQRRTEKNVSSSNSSVIEASSAFQPSNASKVRAKSPAFVPGNRSFNIAAWCSSPSCVSSKQMEAPTQWRSLPVALAGLLAGGGTAEVICTL